MPESLTSGRDGRMRKARQWMMALSVALSLGGAAVAQDEPRSPFAPPSANEPAPPPPKTTPATALDNIEFRGVIEIGGTAWVSVYDPKTKKSYRLTKDELGEDGFSLVKYDAGDKPGEETIVIRQNGLTKQLSLKDADIITLKEAPRQVPQRAAQNVAPNPPAPTRTPPAGNPNMEAASDEEVRERMQRVAEEIRRRRALRGTILNDRNQGN